MPERKIILVDMDNVLADTEGGTLDEWRARYPNRPHISADERRSWLIQEEYARRFGNPSYVIDIENIMATPNFFLNLRPIPGAIDALRTLASSNDVYICTTPFWLNTGVCISEKYAWLEKHAGREWVRRTIPFGDKTMIYGDFLIDDKPEVTGARMPSWEHIVFDWPFNRNVDGVNGKRRLNWGNYREVLGIN